MPSQPRTVQQLIGQAEQCVKDCLECHRVCLETATHCLEMGGRHAEPAHIRLLLDCAEICQTGANFMVRASDLHASICSACAEVCLRCAEDCELFGDDGRMRTCAEVCRRCAESCQLVMAAATKK